MSSYMWLLIVNILFVQAIEDCSEDSCDYSELLTQFMQYINRNQNLTLNAINMSERLNKLEWQIIKSDNRIHQLEQNHCQYKQNVMPTDKSCINEKDSNWIVIQRRQDGSVDFYRTWNEYKEGFGQKNGEFFIGLETLHRLTDSGLAYELLIEMETFSGSKHNASYSQFVVGSESEKYKLKNLGRYHGNAGDSLNYHLHQWFSTKDRRNDQNPNEDCAKSYEGGWWYNECHHSNLNGKYHKDENTQKANGIHWYKVTDYNKSLKFVEMKIRAENCQKK